MKSERAVFRSAVFVNDLHINRAHYDIKHNGEMRSLRPVYYINKRKESDGYKYEDFSGHFRLRYFHRFRLYSVRTTGFGIQKFTIIIFIYVFSLNLKRLTS